MDKDLIRKIVALVLVVVIGAIPINAKAESKTKYVNTGTSYNVYTMTTSDAETQRQRINVPGVEKTDNTTGSITISRTQSFTFSMSATLDAEFGVEFATLGASLGVAAEVTKEIEAGATLSVGENAENGIYYAYMCFPQKRVNYTVQNCTLNHTTWITLYEKTIDYVPQIDMAYYTLIKAS